MDANHKKIGLSRNFAYLFLFLVFTLCSPRLSAERVRLITPNDGLSNSHINHIYQDSKGYIWISTENGLNRFNGYDFEVFLLDPNDSTSITSNFILHVFEDSRGMFWVATSNGLLLYDRVKNSFSQFEITVDDSSFGGSRANYILEDRNKNLWISFTGRGIVRIEAGTLSQSFFSQYNTEIANNTISCMFEDWHGNIWIGTEEHGISVFNPKDNSVRNFQHSPSDPSSLSNNKVYSICEDAACTIWVGTIGGGINVFNENTQSFHIVETDNTPLGNQIYSMILDNDQTIWAATDGAGIFRYDRRGNKISFLEEAFSVCDLKNAKVHTLFQDNQGNIWAAIYQKGVLFISASGSYFNNMGFNPFDVSKSIGSKCVISVIEDSSGNMWAGTDGDGLYRILPSGYVEHFTIQNTPGFRGNVITALFEDNEHNIWIGTYLNGLFRYNRETGKFESNEHSARLNHVTGIVQDDSGKYLFCTNGGGMYVFDPKMQQFKQYYYYADSKKDKIPSNWLFDLFIDSNKTVWVASSNGLIRYNEEKDLFELYSLDGSNQIESNMMYELLEDETGNLWVGTHYGLYCIDKITGKLSLLTTAEGLPDNMIAGIEKYDGNMLWISTGRGLCRYNPETKTFMNFFAEDGIQSNEFRRGSHFKGKNDKMYFGGINGITTFYPSQISYEKPLLDLLFTDFLVNNESVSAGQMDILKAPLNETTKVRLKSNHHSFTFSFAALEFGMPQRVNYFVQMENFDNDWRQISSSVRSVTYTNLNPGKYVFKVEATIDRDNVLQKRMEIVIQPPWWLSLPAKIAYFLLIILLLFGIYVFLSFQNLKQYRIHLEHTVEERTKELLLSKDRAEESDKLKSAFLANMSHEIRTPLNGIMGFIQLISANNQTPERRQEHINVIKNSSLQLARIIDDIIDISKIEAKQMTISPSPVNLNELMNELWIFFNNYLQVNKKENVSLILDDNGIIEQCIVYTDAFRLRQVMNNLISNAIKFTEKGFICFGYRKTEHELLEFYVEDTGIGLRADQIDVIFERFRQADLGSARRIYGGTGLGLTISRSLVNLMGGDIWVESTEGAGSIFFFTMSYLPIEQNDLHIFESMDEPAKENLPLTEKTVLFAASNYLKLKYYEKMISTTGAMVKKAEDLQHLYKIINQPDLVDIVVLDAEFLESGDIKDIEQIRREYVNLPLALIISDESEKYLQFHNLFNASVRTPVKYEDILKIMEVYAK